MRKRQSCFAIVLVGLLLATAAYAQSNTGTTSLTVVVGAEAAIVVNTATTPLTTSGTVFNDYVSAAPTNFTYKIRTSQGGSGGSITLNVLQDFSPAGGPSVGSPIDGETLSYTCAVSNPGRNGSATQCSGSQVASTGGETNVASFGADARTDKNGTGGSVSWVLSNTPAYQTGSYNATVRFTITAL